METMTEQTDNHPGNIAANLWRETYATEADPFEGINLGWADKEASTKWITGIVDAVEEYGDDLELSDALHEIADQAVPIYTAETLVIMSELPLWVSVDDDWDMGTPEGEISVVRVANLRLYEIAYQLAQTAAHRKLNRDGYPAEPVE